MQRIRSQLKQPEKGKESMIRIGSLFSGYGGLDIAARAIYGGKLAWYAEIEPAACKVLAAHHPGVPNLGNVKTINWSTVEPVDILTGGYPCQPFSHAGNRKGTEDERHLWPYVADAIRVVRPTITILENVRGHLSLGFDTVLADIAAMGLSARWGVVRASDAGAPHQRKRVFIVAQDSARRTRGAGKGWGLSEPQRAVRLAASDGRPIANAECTEWRGQKSGDLGTTSGSAAELGERAGAAADADRERHWRGQRPGVVGRVGGAPDVLGRQASTARSESGTGVDTASVAGDAAVTDGVNVGQAERATGDRHWSVAWGKYGPAIHRWERITRPAPVPTVLGVNGRPRLSPYFVEWMMGLPEGHVTGHGLSAAQALKMLGNGVVPQQAILALKMIGHS